MVRAVWRDRPTSAMGGGRKCGGCRVRGDDAVSPKSSVRDDGGDDDLLRAGGSGEGNWETAVRGVIWFTQRRGYSPLRGGIRAAECGDRGAASEIRLQGGGRLHREWPEVRGVLGRVLGGTGSVKVAYCHGLGVTNSTLLSRGGEL